jgi:SNF2 family DNA or RNA helicase
MTDTKTQLPVDEILKPFPDQQVAIDKLRKVPARLCGDSMGVGKTVTGVYLDFALREDRPDLKYRPTLIIPEKIGLEVWNWHLHHCGVPDEETLIIDPAKREPFVAALRQLQATGMHPQYRYFVCHWDVLARIEEINQKSRSGKPLITWAHIIADEVHLAKNRKAQRTLELKRTATLYKTGLTGNPADDKPTDLWSILHWLYPRRFSSYWRFYNNYVQSVWSNQVEEYYKWIASGGSYKTFEPSQDGLGYRVAVGVQNVEELHREIQPFFIRRTLLEVAPNMPSKIHVRPIRTVQLTPKQRKTYESMKDTALARIGSDESGNFTLIAPQTIAILTRLQQFALATLTPEWDVPEGEWVYDEDDPEWEFPKIVLSKPSPKLDEVMAIIEANEEESFVVFSQFRGMADLVEEECARKNISVVKITGQVKSERIRTERVRAFQAGEVRVFVGTIAAAGKTITLTRAHHVIFTDRSWNPSKNSQAEDRLWRRTQRNAVRVIDIEAEDTIDQWRAIKIRSKGDLVRAIMGDKL